MRIICVVGLIGCGKDTATDYIEHKYGYTTINTGDIVRDFTRMEGLELTRDNLQNIRKKYGNNFVAEEAVKIIKEKKLDKILLNGVRRSEDYEIPRAKFGNVMKMILIETDEKKRFERLKKRGDERCPKTMDEFKKQEKNEFAIYNFDKTFSYAGFKIKNNGTPEELHREIDIIMKKIG
jgi:dephospho-CoA kinase